MSGNNARGGGEERKRDAESWSEGGGEWATPAWTGPVGVT